VSQQLDLGGSEHPAGVRLTIRQQAALEFISQHQPAASDVLGAFLHWRRRIEGGYGHDADTRCGYCGEDGLHAAQALARKGLVRRSREGWALAGQLLAQPPLADRGAQGDLPENY